MVQAWPDCETGDGLDNGGCNICSDDNCISCHWEGETEYCDECSGDFVVS